MLDDLDRKNLDQRIDDKLSELLSSTKRGRQNGAPHKQILDQLVSATANHLAAESRLLLSMLYRSLERNTLKKELYQNKSVKADFYELNIKSKIDKRFAFEAPGSIGHKEHTSTTTCWISSGSVLVAGGIISFAAKSVVPIGIAVVTAGIMAVLFNHGVPASPMSVEACAKEYLDHVKDALHQWLFEIEQYYDEQVAAFEEGLNDE